VVFNQTALFDVLREVAFTGITSTYVQVGTTFTVNPRILALHNTTDVDLYISTDAVNNMLRIASGSFKTYDLETNRSATGDNLFPIGTGIWIKETSEGAPTKGNFWVEAVYSTNA
jgi:hypothetical protein